MSTSRLTAACIAATAAVGLPLHTQAASLVIHTIEPLGIIEVADSGIVVRQAWARASAGAATVGAAYVTLIGGSQSDTLIGVSTPIAGEAAVHESMSDNGVMKMRSVAGVSVPAHQVVTFAPGGYHIMMMGLKQPLSADQTFPLTLRFAHAAPITVDVKVRGLGHDHMKM